MNGQGFQEDFLPTLLSELEQRVSQELSILERIRLLGDGLLQWQGEYLADSNIVWRRQSIMVHELTLTGTSPAYNAIVLDTCGRSPQRLRQWMDKNPDQALHMFGELVANPQPVTVRVDGQIQRVMHGMHRTLWAIYHRVPSVEAWVGKRVGPPTLIANLSITYAFTRAYRMGHITHEQLVSALRIIRQMYQADGDVTIPNRLKQEPELIPALNAVFQTKFRLPLVIQVRNFLRRFI